jgi:preprotein translocase subunit SecB
MRRGPLRPEKGSMTPPANNGNGDATPQRHAQFRVLVQYIKDLSFENRSAPRSMQQPPQISVQADVGPRQLSSTDFEVELNLSGKAEVSGSSLFAFDLTYAGIFHVEGAPQESMGALIMIECPRILFPFAREIIASAVVGGGFAPLLLDPIDFVALYQQKAAAFPRRQRATRRAVEIAQSPMSSRDKFEAIYREAVWADAAPTLVRSASRSGHGSTEQSTRLLRRELINFVRQEAIASLFDAPCGDYFWMRLVEFPVKFTYIGGDIAGSVIEELKTRSSAPTHSFIEFDLTRDRFPSCDAWLCKDCFQHLSFEDIAAALKKFGESSIQWALISNHPGAPNANIATGDFRYVDLTGPPFNLPPPRLVLRDSPIDKEPRGVFAWRREDIRARIAEL